MSLVFKSASFLDSQRFRRMLSRYFERIPRVILAGFLIAAVAFVDWRVEANIAFGFLYLFPLLIVGTVLPRLQILLVAALCTFLSDYFDPFPFTFALSLPQDILVFTSLTGAGLFSYEVTRSKRREMENMQRVAREAA